MTALILLVFLLTPAVLLSGLPAAVAALLAIAVVMWLASIKVVLDEGAIRLSSLFRDTTIPWSELDALYVSGVQSKVHGVPTGSAYTLRAISQHRSIIEVTLGSDADGVDALVKQVRALARSHVTPRVAREFAAGQLVQFGPLRLSKQAGIEIQGTLWRERRLISWPQLEDLWLASGELVVKHAPVRTQTTSGATQTTVSISSLPNLDSLMSILEGELQRSSRRS